MRDSFTHGTCSLCGERATRGRRIDDTGRVHAGAWWHDDQSCYVPGSLHPPVRFIPDEDNDDD